MNAEGKSLRDAVDDALRAVFAAEDDMRAGLITGWVTVIEVAGNDGDPYLHTLRSDGLMPWKALGMLEAMAGDLRYNMLQPAGVDDE